MGDQGFHSPQGHFPPSMQPGPLSMIAFARLTCGAHNFMLIPVCMVAPFSSDFCGGKKERPSIKHMYTQQRCRLNSDIHCHRLQRRRAFVCSNPSPRSRSCHLNGRRSARCHDECVESVLGANENLDPPLLNEGPSEPQSIKV